MSNDKLIFKNVWKSQTEDDTTKIIEFWKQLGVLPAGQDGQKRAKEVVFMVLNEENQVCALCTSYLVKIPDLCGNYYAFRCLVAPAYRQAELAGDLLNTTFDFFDSHVSSDIKGMYLEVENKFLIQHKNEAVWPKTKFTFVGVTARGTHRRIRYFKDARI